MAAIPVDQRPGQRQTLDERLATDGRLGGYRAVTLTLRVLARNVTSAVARCQAGLAASTGQRSLPARLCQPKSHPWHSPVPGATLVRPAPAPAVGRHATAHKPTCMIAKDPESPRTPDPSRS